MRKPLAPPRWRLLLALAGAVVLLVALCLLAYALLPTGTVIEQFRPPATLFAPPQSLALSLRWL